MDVSGSEETGQTDLNLRWCGSAKCEILTYLPSTLLLDRICVANSREFLIEGYLECQSQI